MATAGKARQLQPPPDEVAQPSPARRRKKAAEVEAPRSASDGMTEAERRKQFLYDTLCQSVDDQIREAIAARENNGIEQIWDEDEDQYNGVDDMSQAFANVKLRSSLPKDARDNRSKVFVPITKPKTDVGVARVSEMLLPNDDKPWDIKPTAIPDIEQDLQAGPNEMMQLGDGSQAPKAVVAQFIMAKAKEKAEREADWIEDKFQEGSVYTEMRQVVRDAGRIGTGVLKGPVPVLRRNQRWLTTRGKDGQMQVKLKIDEKTSPTSKCIRAQDCFPDAGCGDNIHKGEMFAEREYLTGRALRDMAKLPGYDAKCIIEALKEGPRPYVKSRDSRWRQTPGDTSNDAKLFEVFHYYGFASPEQLEALMDQGNPEDTGIDRMDGTTGDDQAAEPTAPEQQDDPYESSPLKSKMSREDYLYLSQVPVIVTMLHNKPIKAELNPLETGRFPYDFFPWEPIKGQVWGRGIPRKMAVAQRIVNAGVRSLLENAGLSAGPQIVTMKGAIEPWDGNWEVKGRKGWHFIGDGEMSVDDVNKAFQVFNIESVQVEMSAIIQFGLDLADILTNLPMLMQGDQQAGTSPETLGGLKLLFNNAMSPLRVCAKLFDDNLIGPHLKGYHDWFMQDPEVPAEMKEGDSEIVTKGSTALIQREEGREFLISVFAVKDDPTLRIDPVKFIKELARSNGFDMSTVQYTDEEWKKIEEQKAKQSPPMEPAVEAAKIRSQALLETAKVNAADADKQRQFDMQLAEQDRQHATMMATIDERIADKKLSMEERKALTMAKTTLANAAMGNRTKVDEMQLKLLPQNTSGLGI